MSVSFTSFHPICHYKSLWLLYHYRLRLGMMYTQGQNANQLHNLQSNYGDSYGQSNPYVQQGGNPYTRETQGSYGGRQNYGPGQTIGASG